LAPESTLAKLPFLFRGSGKSITPRQLSPGTLALRRFAFQAGDLTGDPMKTKAPVSAPNRDARGRWLPGKSENDMGRPRSALAELCRLQITKHGLVGVLGAIAASKNDYAARTKIPITVSDQINAIRLLLLYVAVVPVNVSPALMDFMATPIELFHCCPAKLFRIWLRPVY
jgi:hypothetical protein